MKLHTVPRPEHPQPQMQREDWTNLNGEWDFYIDYGNSGRDRKLHENSDFSDKIIVPFCPESRLSGIEHKDFMPAVWYHRKLMLKKNWTGQGSCFISAQWTMPAASG